jgi:hypothetical protein
MWISHAGKDSPKKFDIRNKFIQWIGNKTRIYLDFYILAGGLQNSELEFYAIRNDAVKDIHVKLGNHGMVDFMFGGFGVAFEENKVSINHEYFHNEHGNPKNVYLERLIPNYDLIGYRIRIENTKVEDSIWPFAKMINAWIDYGDGEWYHVVHDKTIKQEDWHCPLTPEDKQLKKDSMAVNAGVYTGPCHQWWIRLNSDRQDESVLKVKSIKIRKL